MLYDLNDLNVNYRNDDINTITSVCPALGMCGHVLGLLYLLKIASQCKNYTTFLQLKVLIIIEEPTRELQTAWTCVKIIVPVEIL